MTARLPVGIQLYSVSEPCRKDFAGTLKVLAGMGYRGVEFAWSFGGLEPEELAELMRQLGLACVSMYFPVADLLNPEHELYRYARALGSTYVTTGDERLVRRDWRAAIRDVEAAARVAADRGLTLLYHNHAGEFERLDGRSALDQLLDETDSALVQLELDTHFALKVGEDPVSWLRRYTGRVPSVHLKDIRPETGAVAEVGEGALDVAAVWDAGRTAGARWMVAEFHDIPRRPPLDSARLCLANLRRLGLIA